MNGLQILLIVVIVTLTILLLVIGIQIFFIIAGIRKVIRKVNAMLEGKEGLDEVVTRQRVRNVLIYFKGKLPFKL